MKNSNHIKKKCEGLHICETCKYNPPSNKWPCKDCDIREPADRWKSNMIKRNKYEE